jgi:hypothetical protein
MRALRMVGGVMTDATWANFIRDINPTLLETERYKMPPASERPGSAADIRREREHNERRAAYWRKRWEKFEAPDAAIAAMVAESAAYTSTTYDYRHHHVA